MKRNAHILLSCLLITMLCILITACHTEDQDSSLVISKNASVGQQAAIEPTEQQVVTEATSQNVVEGEWMQSSFVRSMIISDLVDDEYVFVSCLDVTKELEMHNRKVGNVQEETAPDYSEQEVYIDPKDTSKYVLGKKESKPDTTAVVSSEPGNSEIPLNNVIRLPFWGYGKDTVISENAEFKNENGAGFWLDVEKCSWGPEESSVEIGLCNLETKKCYSYPIITDCGSVCHRLYDFSEVPLGTYRIFVRKTLGETLNDSFLQFSVYGRPNLTVVE